MRQKFKVRSSPSLRLKNLTALVCMALILEACQTSPIKVESDSSSKETATYVNESPRFPSAPMKYKIIGTCNGLPKIDVKTAPGFCVGIVDLGEGMAFPRGVLPINNKQLLVTDMGSGWSVNTGRLYLLTRNGNSYERKTILDGKSLLANQKKLMDRPHTVLLGPDQKIWIASASTIYTIDPLASEPIKSVSIKIDGLPTDGLHPLKMITFDSHNHLFVNMGATTNVCQKFGAPTLTPPQLCPEAEGNNDGRGLIRKYTLKADGNIDPNFEILAKGLRNSMAMVWSEEKDLLLQAENSRDFIHKIDAKLNDAFLPAEEINVIKEGQHYGWPYCYNDGKISPEFYNFDCQKYQSPHLMLPAHASPLSMLIYKGNQFPDWYKNRIIMSLHGYREFGHRIVTFKRDDQGLPTGTPLSVVYDWEARGEQAMGSPVVIAQAPDGSLFVAEDKNKKILQIFYDPKLGDGKPVLEIGQNKENAEESAEVLASRKKSFQERLSQNPIPLFTEIQAKLINQNCIQCHGGSSYPGIQMRENDDLVNAEKFVEPREGRSPLVIPGKPMESEFYLRVSGKAGARQMPPQGFSSVAEQKALADLIQQWIEQGAPAPEAR